MKNYLLLSRVSVHNANAMSSIFTIGVPAMTAWLGAMHALERNLGERCDQFLSDIRFTQMAVSYHKTSLQTIRKNGIGYIVMTANPLVVDKKKSSKDNYIFKRAPLLEEPRIHLLVSLLIEVEGADGNNMELLEQAVKEILPRMKMAGGDILDTGRIKVMRIDEDNPISVRKVISTLMPGYIPIERRDLMEAKELEGKDSLDRLLHYLKVHQTAEKDESGKITGWKYEKAAAGWIVPLAVGFKGLSPLGKVKNQRDPDTPHRFAESIVTLGEFKMAHRFRDIDGMMWHYAYEKTNQLYLCKNKE